MSAMRDEKERAAQLERLAPKPSAQELEAVNGLFRHFLFRRSGRREIWTTCCRQHRIIEDATDAEWEVLDAPHAPEPKNQYDNTPQHKVRHMCPYCGAQVTVKELRYTGSRKNLWGFRRVLLLRQWRGALWATAWDCIKNYGAVERLTEMPEMTLLGVYRFTPGLAECGTRSWWTGGAPLDYEEQRHPGKGSGKNKMWHIHSPFTWCTELGMSYDIIGLPELQKSALRWCRLEQVRIASDDFIELLTAACFYPRQIEWLVKLGLGGAVVDLAGSGVKNADLIRWGAERPKDFLKCTRTEVLEVTGDGNIQFPLDVLKVYARGRNKPEKMSLRAAAYFAGMSGYHDILQKATRLMRAHGVTADRLCAYLEKSRAAMEGMQCIHGYHSISSREAARLWLDYIDAAVGCGLDLTNPVILMPKDLSEKHDRVTAAWSAIQHQRREAEKLEKQKTADRTYKKRMKELTDKYLYWTDDFLIRAPVNAAEIAEEGKKLRHCVGGYADRHMNGATTILLLRRRDRPHTPLATIEMNGNRIMQVHGYRNEIEPCAENPERVSARELYKNVLDPWLKWLKGGSKREKDGRPKLPKNKRRNAA